MPDQLCQRSWSWMVLWRPTGSSRTNTHKRCPFNFRRLECKIGSQEIPEVTSNFGLWAQNETEKRLTEFCQENTLVIQNTLFQQHKRRLYTWTSPDGKHRNQIDYILCSQRWRSSIQPARTRLGADCGSDHELLLQSSDINWIKSGKRVDHSGMTKTKSLTIIQWKWQTDSGD